MADIETRTPADEMREAALSLRANPQRPVDAPLAAWLAKSAKTFHEEVALDQAECPACGDGCCADHGDLQVHEGGCGGVLFAGGEEECRCFADALLVSRVLNGTSP